MRLYGGTITIGTGQYHTDIIKKDGLSAGNWAAEVKKNEVKEFFDPHRVDIEATGGTGVGWAPTGLITFGSELSIFPTTDVAQVFDQIKDGAYIELSIGSREEKYSHRVYLKKPAEPDEEFNKGTGDKRAVSHVDIKTDSGEKIIDILINDFPARYLGSEEKNPGRDLDMRKDGFPYYVSRAKGPDNKRIVIGKYDRKQISEKIEVSLDYKGISEPNLKKILFDPIPSDPLFKVKDIENIEEETTLIITLTSRVAGYSESTIGQPVNADDIRNTTRPIRSNKSDTNKAWVQYTLNDGYNTPFGAYELAVAFTSDKKKQNALDYKFWSENGTPGAPQIGVDPVKDSDVKEPDLNRLDWL